MKITVETTVNADLDTVWDPWNSPEDIKRWNSAQDDWHTIWTTSRRTWRGKGRMTSRGESRK